MGACCTCQRGQRFDGFIVEDDIEEEREVEDDDIRARGDYGARVMLQGSSKLISMFSQQGRKGINQDAMTVWQKFGGDEDMLFCGVFDGHGPSGHLVARHVRDTLPSKLSSSFKHLEISTNNHNSGVSDESNQNVVGENGQDNDDYSQNPLLNACKSSLVKSFQDMDIDLETESTIESYCSGTTAVTVVKQGQHLLIANLGDSRAVLCTRDIKDQLVSEQLTVDLKPNLPREAERIKKCRGRVLAMEEEPSVYRVWMPDQNCPGLAMARAFGDFCLKDFGLISIPEVSYRKITERDEFVVLATDGVWDVLSNNEVISIVASARKRSMAARLLVDRAVRTWRIKYPAAKVDDCAVVCLFFKRPRPFLTKSMSEVTQLSLNYSDLGVFHHARSAGTEDGLETVLNWDRTARDEGAGRVGSSSNLPQVGSDLNRRRLAKDLERVET